MFPVFVDQGRVVGWAVVGPSRDPDCDQAQVYELYGIYFLESYWGGGYGKRLYRAAEQRIVAGAKEIKVWVLEGNARALLTGVGFNEPLSTIDPSSFLTFKAEAHPATHLLEFTSPMNADTSALIFHLNCGESLFVISSA